MHTRAFGYTMETILLILLLAGAVFLTAVIMFQKSKDDGLSSTIVGGSDTYYAKDKANRKEKTLRKWTIAVGAFFIAAVLLVYFLQPDYVATTGGDGWKNLSGFSNYFKLP